MSRERRDLWDKRNRTALPGEPEVSVREFEPLLPRGRALDVAAGPGRNSIALARAGMHVIAADFSPPAMRSLAALAAR
ncbi:MAG TPA: hypothetical protein VJN94_05595, partial [Candidatus Binataceae bacterium]|nr:hypothetical protein [Candidatus Binataceae bacterium]